LSRNNEGEPDLLPSLQETPTHTFEQIAESAPEQSLEPTPTPTPEQHTFDSDTTDDQWVPPPYIPIGYVYDVEGEVAWIRDVWQTSREVIYAGDAQVSGTADVRTLITDPRVRTVEITAGTNGISYSRIYLFHDGSLIFAFWAGEEQHRMYFYAGLMFRWRYTPASGERVDFDNMRDYWEFIDWEDSVYQDIWDLGIS